MKGIATYLALLIFSFLVTITFFACGVKVDEAKEECKQLYEMPSGAICKVRAGEHFQDCDDGRTYIRPESYRRIKGMGCYEN